MVDETNSVIQLDGQRYSVTEDQLRVVKRLKAARGGSVIGDDLKQELGSDERPGRIIERIRKLDPKLRAVLKSSGKGYRLDL